MSDYLAARIEALVTGAGDEREPVEPDAGGFTERVSIGNLRPLLWRDWCRHLEKGEHDRLAEELDAELAAMTGPLTGRARQIAWYLSAELLIDEDHSRLVPVDKGQEGDERAKAFQKSLVKLLSDLIGFASSRPRSTGIPTTRSCCGCTRRRRLSASGSTGMLVQRVAGLRFGEQSVHDLASRRHAPDRHEHRRPCRLRQ